MAAPKRRGSALEGALPLRLPPKGGTSYLAVGLAAAIPAYVFYNKFATEAGRFTGRLDSFADDLAAAVARRLGERFAERS